MSIGSNATKAGPLAVRRLVTCFRCPSGNVAQSCPSKNVQEIHGLPSPLHAMYRRSWKTVTAGDSFVATPPPGATSRLGCQSNTSGSNEVYQILGSSWAPFQTRYSWFRKTAIAGPLLVPFPAYGCWLVQFAPSKAAHQRR